MRLSKVKKPSQKESIPYEEEDRSDKATEDEEKIPDPAQSISSTSSMASI